MLLLPVACYHFDGRMHAALSGSRHDLVRVLYDSPSVERLYAYALQKHSEHKAGLASKDEKIQMATFMDFQFGKISGILKQRLKSLPSYSVGGGTEFVILAEDDIFPYDKVRFESGPVKGRIGWIARGSFRDGRFDWP